jgi:hypothetical protein
MTVAEPAKADDSLAGGAWLVVLALLALIGVQTFFPLLPVGLVTNDDLKLANAARDRGLQGVASVLWAFTRRDGRLDITQILSWYVPFARPGFAYFKTVTLAAIVADIVLFALLVRSILRTRVAFVLALLLALVGLQNSWEHCPLAAFPGLFTITLAYLLASLLAFQRHLGTSAWPWLAASAALFLVVLCSYEMYVIYLPVFVGLALLAGRSPRETGRILAWHLAAVALFLAAWLTSHHLRVGNYPGVTLAPLDLGRIAHVVWQFSVSSLPPYFFFHEKYEALFRNDSRAWGLDGLRIWLHAGALVKAALVGGIYAFVMLRPVAVAAARRRRLAAMLAAGVVYFFAPSVLPALTRRYQDEIQQQLGMQASYFSSFAWMWTAAVLLLLASQTLRGVVRRVFVGATAAVLMCASVFVDYTNAGVAQWQGQGRARFEMVDAFLATPDYAAVPEGAIIYAPSLWQTVGTINYVGTAIDPRPSPDERYENFWTFYFTVRGGKRVSVTDRLERIPPGWRGFYFLRHARPGAAGGEYLVFAHVERGSPSPHRLVSDRVVAYDRSSWVSRMIGGTVVDTGGAPVTVGVVGGPRTETAGPFLFDVANHVYKLGILERCGVATPDDVIDPESVFLAPGLPAPDGVLVKTAGWLLDGWIGAEARANVRVRAPARLVLAAYAPDYIFKRAGASAVTLTLELDHRVIATRSVTQGGRFRVEANVAAGMAGELVVRCAPVHTPRAVGQGADDRDLCVLIERAEVRAREPGE